ncbi:MAG TPA: hypothetical protein VJR89_13345, partial [Polyangiales bacterium]|nr:hypothetical protein [Polyangiales bacterium]
MISSDTADESSVVFNLRQLMQLEEQRVLAEAEARRTQLAAAERAQREAEARTAELARQRALEAERRQAERDAAALRA